MRIVLLGAGTVGIQIARELIAENRDVVVIERDPELARLADNELDCLVLNEDGSRPETLRKAETHRADWFIALTGSDAVNIVACGLVAAESPKTRTIARMEASFYNALSNAQKKTFGLDFLVNPAMETARSLSRIIAEGFAEQVTPLHDGSLQLRMVETADLPGYVGKTLSEIKMDSSAHYLIAAVVREGRIHVPKGDFKIREEDRLYVLGLPEVLDAVLGAVEGLTDVPRRIVILGATKVSERLISLLQNRNETASNGFAHAVRRFFQKKSVITLVDASEPDCKKFAQAFQNITVIHGDCAEEGVLESAGVAKADLFVAATDSQSKNIITAQLAKTLGSKKAMAVTLNHRFLPIGPDLEVDSFVCANDAIAASVLETLRKGHIRTIYSFYEDSVEIAELRLDARSPVAGKKLREVDLPSDVLIAFLHQNSGFIVPTGNTVLNAGDTIALIVHKTNITEIENIFGGADGD